MQVDVPFKQLSANYQAEYDSLYASYLFFQDFLGDNQLLEVESQEKFELDAVVARLVSLSDRIRFDMDKSMAQMLENMDPAAEKDAGLEETFTFDLPRFDVVDDYDGFWPSQSYGSARPNECDKGKAKIDQAPIIDESIIARSSFEEDVDYNIALEQLTPDDAALECSICFEEVTAKPTSTSQCVKRPLISFAACNHHFCTECLEKWLHVAIKMPTTQFPMACPIPGCRSILQPGAVARKIISDSEIYQMFVEKHIVATEDAIFCPRKVCSQLIICSSEIADVANLIQCQNCGTDICKSCKVGSHAPMTCQQFQKLPIKDRNPEDLLFYRIVEEKRWGHCPACKMVIERKDGCNYMKCTCGCGFCYRCGIKYNETSVIATTSHGTPGCRCGLFDVPHEPHAPPQPQPIAFGDLPQ